MEEIFYGSSVRLKGIGYFRRRAPLLMFYGILNVTVSEENVSTIGVSKGNHELLLRPNSPNSHQTQIQEYEVLD